MHTYYTNHPWTCAHGRLNCARGWLSIVEGYCTGAHGHVPVIIPDHPEGQCNHPQARHTTIGGWFNTYTVI